VCVTSLSQLYWKQRACKYFCVSRLLWWPWGCVGWAPSYMTRRVWIRLLTNCALRSFIAFNSRLRYVGIENRNLLYFNWKMKWPVGGGGRGGSRLLFTVCERRSVVGVLITDSTVCITFSVMPCYVDDRTWRCLAFLFRFESHKPAVLRDLTVLYSFLVNNGVLS
jgi:hypothetical protein